MAENGPIERANDGVLPPLGFRRRGPLGRLPGRRVDGCSHRAEPGRGTAGRAAVPNRRGTPCGHRTDPRRLRAARAVPAGRPERSRAGFEACRRGDPERHGAVWLRTGRLPAGRRRCPYHRPSSRRLDRHGARRIPGRVRRRGEHGAQTIGHQARGTRRNQRTAADHLPVRRTLRQDPHRQRTPLLHRRQRKRELRRPGKPPGVYAEPERERRHGYARCHPRAGGFRLRLRGAERPAVEIAPAPRRTVPRGPGLPRWRRRPPRHSDWWAGHEHGRRRLGGPSLEARRHDTGLGRTRSARQLRTREAQGRGAQRPSLRVGRRRHVPLARAVDSPKLLPTRQKARRRAECWVPPRTSISGGCTR